MSPRHSTDIVADVRAFNEAMGVDMRTTAGWCNDEDLTLAINLIDEEVTEFITAVKYRDMIETADGLIDSLYVLVGLGTRIGWLTENMMFLQNLDGQDPIGFPTDTSAVISDTEERLILIKTAAKARDLHSLRVDTNALIINLTFAGYTEFHLPLKDLWDTVQVSNMSKRTGSKVLKNKQGKVLKPPTFEPPQIETVLNKHGWNPAAA